MSAISIIEGVIRDRLLTVTEANGYAQDVAQVILPKRHPDWQPLPFTYVVKSRNEIPAPESSCQGNPPAIGRQLPVQVSAIVIPSKLDNRSFDEIATDFAAEAVQAITYPADWHTFGSRAINASIGPINFTEPDGEDPGGASFMVNVIFRTSEKDPNEFRG